MVMIRTASPRHIHTTAISAPLSSPTLSHRSSSPRGEGPVAKRLTGPVKRVAIERQRTPILAAGNEPGHRPAIPPELRELDLGFGDSGYVALYRHEPEDDAVYVLAFRHPKEAGY